MTINKSRRPRTASDKTSAPVISTKFLVIMILTIFLTSCSRKNVKYAGLNDLMVGVQQVVLYDDQTFYIELSAGGVDGHYKIKADTILLTYENKPSDNWPDSLFMDTEYFHTLDKTTNSPINYRRTK